MAEGVKARVKAPRTVAAGETVVIKTLISHQMESGQRKDSDGSLIPRSIINRFAVAYNGQNVIDVALAPAISTNPYFEFEAVIPEAGDMVFTWYDDDGSVYEEVKSIAIG
ncbi:thiosulfate oxidation carrier complex protein SoxZ [Rhodovulum sulfidophilum]|uniref:SoxZ n=1 Tax=Rhodovulum sulfidophilum TaxID=35806 RepID=Q939U2_RHOSU|nr:thiosulfate oxidation carrier complex protein SoxZ [Rhodovulum sulfidophilum]AAF99433.1 SoxZ [Rhodovulum sulfidophilum]ANB34297.1 thiosulfate oxidation carrier complex protein SoxZ [Rhodovulum sulfidophilum DSM 1374]ANB38120.1 thiosulfate oxidation carrier complex protein SoxZ [Rhodovulum sulfidophilum]MBK5924188.1 thiosulfate oxidation carrier complex protein SoxZ [Rhodovulum sulfidophilum]MBL3551757.1 thiosulfate oxidation carrier complex protein SoxZ [Rhodovulum sulfidophilum]